MTSGSRLHTPHAVMEVVITAYEDHQITWQHMDFSGQRWPVAAIKRFLTEVARALPLESSPPQGGSPTAAEAEGPVLLPLVTVPSGDSSPKERI